MPNLVYEEKTRREYEEFKELEARLTPDMRKKADALFLFGRKLWTVGGVITTGTLLATIHYHFNGFSGNWIPETIATLVGGLWLRYGGTISEPSSVSMQFEDRYDKSLGIAEFYSPRRDVQNYLWDKYVDKIDRR